MSTAFLDTNVVLYLLSEDMGKADRAEAILAQSGIILSVQVLNEATAVCRRKLRMPWEEIEEFLTVLKAACPVVPLTLETHERALAIARRHHLSWYDALICAAAALAGATRILSEDMSHGQAIDGLPIENPFLAA